MKFEADLIAGTVTAEFTLAEFQEVLVALNAQAEAVKMSPPKPDLSEPGRLSAWVLDVLSDSNSHVTYETRIWFDITGDMHYSCTCPHHTHRGAWCKHLVRSDITRDAEARKRRALAASLS